jgi:hypothetical protein
MRRSHPVAGGESDILSLEGSSCTLHLLHPVPQLCNWLDHSSQRVRRSFRPEQSPALFSIVAMPGRLFATLLACSVLFSLEAAAAPLVQNLQTAFPVE